MNTRFLWFINQIDIDFFCVRPDNCAASANGKQNNITERQVFNGAKYCSLERIPLGLLNFERKKSVYLMRELHQ